MKRNKIFIFNRYILLLILILAFLVTGGTYSYLAYRYENSSVIQGNVISVNAELNVELVKGSNNKLVPLKDDRLTRAINGTGGKDVCIDSNGNLSCQIYKITLTNKGSRIKDLVGTIELYASNSSSKYTNLSWRELSDLTTVKDGSTIHGMSKSALVSNLTMESKEVRTWYIAVYIKEVGRDQTNTDKGKFGGTVTFETVAPKTTLALGDYVSMTPTKSSYTTDTSMTGYERAQTINPQELNLWRVIKLNDDGTVEMISEHVSSTSVYFMGQTGYQNFVGYLNVLASQYENSTYTSGSRYFGYNGQTEYITDTSQFTNPAPWTCSTGESCNPVESQGGGDALYQADYDLITTVLGIRIATKPGDSSASGYWMTSRKYDYISSTSYGWDVRCIDRNGYGAVNYFGLYEYFRSKFGITGKDLSLRPIVVLKSGLKYSGLGTEYYPMEISAG